MLYDTSIFVDYLRNFPVAMSYFHSPQIDQPSNCCSVITEAELWQGVREDRDEVRIAELLSRFNVVPITRDVARLAGNLLRPVIEKKTHFGDALIAATPMRQGETVLTADAESQRVFGIGVSYLMYR